MNRRLIYFILLLSISIVFAQPGQRSGSARGTIIKGLVQDNQLKTPIEYANIILYKQKDTDQVTGTVSNKEGLFTLTGVQPGLYKIKIKFMGYYENTVDSVRVSANQPAIDVGKVGLNQTVLMLEGVQVEAEKAPVEYKIDRKVINVDHQITASAGSAVDVLENVPSITVDIEGNVQLRGSGSFTVLIDNRPTVMDASDLLQQIPASTIENIEIITNPSAKYEPDGMTGIVNIITKKNSLRGFNGIVNLNSGVDDKYGGDFLFNYRMNNVNTYFGMNYNHRYFPGDRIGENWTAQNDTIHYLNTNGSNSMDFTSYGVQAGVDIALSKQDNFKVGLNYRGRGMEHANKSNYEEWISTLTDRDYYSSTGSSERSGPSYNMNLDYLHRFETKGHELSALLNLSSRSGDEESLNENYNANGAITNGQRSVEKGPSMRADLKLDYTRPLGENNKLEAGYQGRFSRSKDENELYEYDLGISDYVFLPQYSYLTNYNRDIHAVYSMYAGETGPIGYQAGLRGEYTNRNITLDAENQEFAIDRWDLFPTAHLSFKGESGHQMMASYTRRIDRPRGYYFEPFLTWMDAYNVRTGNPAIKPEYIDSYEMGYQKQVGQNLFSVETYYRITHDRVERVQSVYDENVLLHSVANVGQDYALGAEFMINWDLLSNWNMNLMGNMYDYRIEGELLGADFSRSSFNWNTRMNNTFKLTQNSRVQFNLRYNSPSVSAQGRREGFFSSSIAYRHDFLDKRISMTLQARDVFGTEVHERISEGDGFYSYSKFDRNTPIITMTMSYKINNFKANRGKGNDGGGGDDFGGEGEY